MATKEEMDQLQDMILWSCDKISRAADQSGALVIKLFMDSIAMVCSSENCDLMELAEVILDYAMEHPPNRLSAQELNEIKQTWKLTKETLHEAARLIRIHGEKRSK